MSTTSPKYTNRKQQRLEKMARSLGNSPLFFDRRPMVFGRANSTIGRDIIDRPVHHQYSTTDDSIPNSTESSPMIFRKPKTTPKNSLSTAGGGEKSKCQRIWKNLKTTTQVALRIKSNNVGQIRQIPIDDDEQQQIIMITSAIERNKKSTNADEHTDETYTFASKKCAIQIYHRSIDFAASQMTVQSFLNRQMIAETATSSSTTDPIMVPYVTFLVKIRIKSGHDLVIRDASGSSDPYVKLSYKNKMVYKTNTIFKNLNPIWDEEFSQLIDDPTMPISLSVFDFDRFMSDDFMGETTIDLSQLKLFQLNDMQLNLSETGSDEYMGYVRISVTIIPQTAEEMDTFIKRSTRGILSESQKKPTKAQVWISVVNIVLVEGKNLLPTEISTSYLLPDPYVKFKLGNEKYKSKPVAKSLDPKWLEQFDLHIFDDSQQTLEIMVYDKRNNQFMGRCSIDLSEIEREITHQRSFALEDGAGSIMLLLSITGTTSSDTVVDLKQDFTNADVRQNIIRQYSITRTFQNLRDVGYLTVKVFKAQNLASADINGKSDPFAVVELVNARLQTHTEYKTLNPEWNKLFTFAVKDIHSVVEITVYDEDPNKKVEFLGKLAIPLLRIRNCKRRWYVLKDRKLQNRAKGQILLEMDVIWNPIRAAIRTIHPKETKYISQMQRFKRQLFIDNVQRLKQFAMSAVEIGNFLQSCFNWDSTLRSAIVFICYIIVVYNFEIYMLPICLLLLFCKAFVIKKITESMRSRQSASIDVDCIEDQNYFDSDDDDGESNDKNEIGISIKDRVTAVQDTLAMVQNSLDFIASLLERVRNTFNFTQPYLSVLAITALIAATILLYFVPLRWLIMAWGINKFTKKLRNPHFIPNNELLDFLSRVPCDKDLRSYVEFRPEPMDNHQAREYIQRQAIKRMQHSS